jgi:hypothetical protein
MDTNDEVIPETPDLEETDTTDWKAKAQELQGQLKESRGIAKRYQTKAQKAAEPKAPEVKAAAPEKKGFDYAEKAYLKSSGIEASDFDLVKEVMDSTGKDIDGVLSSKFFLAELKERKELRMTEAATPSGSKRAGNTTKDQVDYWLAKGELPPTDQPELRRKVVNARIANESSKSQFADQAVAGAAFK